jgi:hypothetical protein
MMKPILSVIALGACGGGATGSPDAATVGPDAPAGSSSITGMVGGTTFTSAMSVYWIGSPDSPSSDTVIYLFDHVVACDQIVNAGWDTGLAAGTQILELKMVGKAPSTYPETTAATHVPAPGESASSYTVAAAGATDMIASGGTVTLSSLGAPSAGSFAVGTFHVTFPSGALDGAYTAPFCLKGREP